MTGMEEIPLEIQEDIASFCNKFRVNLLDIHSLETSDIFRTDLREVFGFFEVSGRQRKTKAIRRRERGVPSYEGRCV